MPTRLGYVLAQRPGQALVHFFAHDDPELEDELDGLPFWIAGYPNLTFVDPMPTGPPWPVVKPDGEIYEIPAAPLTGVAFVTWIFPPKPAQWTREEVRKKPFRPSKKTMEEHKKAREKRKKKLPKQGKLF